MKGRLLSLDIMRGITVAGMIVVNNAGGPLSYDLLRHAEWNGLTPCDLVFPFFLFIMGISTYISLRKFNFQASRPLIGKIVKRTLSILLIGWAIHWIDLLCKGNYLPFDYFRLTGVLPRIAVCYCCISFIAISVPHRLIKWIVVTLLLAYTVLLLIGNGYINDSTNLLARIDHWLLGASHLYSKRPIDPEGIAGTISAVAHCLIGFDIGRKMLSAEKNREEIIQLFIIGFLLMSVGFLMTEALPLNKRIWSPSFVLVTCGIAVLLQTSLLYHIDIQGCKRLYGFFRIFGVNPLFLYVASEVLAILLNTVRIKPVIYHAINSLVVNPYLASAIYAMLFTLFMALCGYPLYKRKIYIKL